MVTSNKNPNDIQKAKEHQVCGYISKPLTEEKMLTLIEKAIQEIQKCPC